MSSTIEALVAAFKGSDNEAKTAKLLAFHRELQSDPPQSLSDPDAVLTVLKSALSKPNAHVQTAALTCLPEYFPLLLPASLRVASGQSSSHSSPHPTDASGADTSKSSHIRPGSALGHHSSSSAQAPLRHAIKELSSLLFDRMGDARERVRELARDSLLSLAETSLRLGPPASAPGATARDRSGNEIEHPYTMLDRQVLSLGLKSKNARTRSTTLSFVALLRNCRATNTLPLRSITPTLVTLLEDSDPTVRDVAKSTVVDVYGKPEVSNPARADLKKELAKQSTRKAVNEWVMSQVLNRSSTTTSSSTPLSGVPSNSIRRNDSGVSLSSAVSGPHHSGALPAPVSTDAVSNTSSRVKRSHSPPVSSAPSSLIPRPGSRATSNASQVPGAPQLTKHPPSRPGSRMGDPPPPGKNDQQILDSAGLPISPVYVASARDLESEFAPMLPAWEGKEDEHNWKARDSNIARIRGMIIGGAHLRFRTEFLSGIKLVTDGIFKTLASLRTTVCTCTCNLISELAMALGPSFDSFLDVFLVRLLSMAGQTKKLSAQTSQQAITSLLTHCSYHTKTLQRLHEFMSEKTSQSRQYVIGHVKTMVEIHGIRHRTAIESGGALEFIEKSVKKGLADANPTVRDIARATFWVARPIFANMATKVYNTLDATTKKLLDKVNPGVEPIGNDPLPSQRPANAGGARKLTVKEMIREKAKQQQQENLLQTAIQTTLPSSPSSPSSQPSDLATPKSSRSARPAPVTDSGADATKGSRPANAAKLKQSSGPGKGIGTRRRPETPSTTTSVSTSGGVANNTRNKSSPLRAKPQNSTAQSSKTASQLLRTPPRPTRATIKSQASPTSPEAGDFSLIGDTGRHLNRRDSDAQSENKMFNDKSLDLTAMGADLGDASLVKPDYAHTRNIMDMSIDEPIVADALQAQAEQAEQAAERLLELVEPDDADHGMFFPPSLGPGGKSHSSQSPLRSLARTNGSSGRKRQSVPDSRAGEGLFDESVDDQGIRTNLPQDEHWWLKRNNRAAAQPPSPKQHGEEVINLIGLLQSREISSRDLHKLSRLSTEHPCSLEDDSDVFGTPCPVDADEATESVLNNAFWRNERLFDRLFEGICNLLRLCKDNYEQTDAGLVVLKTLVQNQFIHFSGHEMEVLSLFLDVNTQGNKNVTSALEAISDLFLNQVEPLYGLSALRTTLQGFLDLQTRGDLSNLNAGTKSSYALGLKAFGVLFARLPAEVVEEELPRARNLIHQALNDGSHPDLRQAAINCLVYAESALGDESKIFQIIPDLTTMQKQLLTYYCAKHAQSEIR